MAVGCPGCFAACGPPSRTSSTRSRSPCPCPAVVTVHDLSFERDPAMMGLRDRLIFRTVVPRAARLAARVLAVSELTKRDLIELYGIPEEKIVVTPNGVDPAFTPEGPSPNGEPYALFVGALQPRKDARVAIEALALLGEGAPKLVVVGKDQGGRDEAERAAARTGSPTGSSSAATCRRRSLPPSIAAPPASSSRLATKASACPSSRRWPPGRP